MHMQNTASVMVNFLCQLDWAMGCPDIWLNILPSCVYEVVVDKINTGISKVKQTALASVGGPHALC